MCPACLASMALLVTGIVSTGGVTAAAVKILRDKKIAARIAEARKPQVRDAKGFRAGAYKP
jgi:pyrroline-5-carboxylate reductase